MSDPLTRHRYGGDRPPEAAAMLDDDDFFADLEADDELLPEFL